jgi:O-antigen ligase
MEKESLDHGGGHRLLPGLALAALLVLAPLPFGAVHGWAVSVVEVTVFLLVGVTIAAEGLHFLIWSVRPLLLPGLTLLAFAFFQIVSLPVSLLRVMSPAAASLSTEMLGANGAWVSPSLNPYGSILQLVLLLSLAGAFLLAACAPLPGRSTLILWSVLVSGAVNAAIGWWHFSAGWETQLFGLFSPVYEIRGWERLHWPFVNPDHMATLMAVVSVLAAGAFIWPRLLGAFAGGAAGVPHRLFAGLVLALTAPMLVRTGSRGGMGAAVAGLLVMAILWPAEKSAVKLIASAGRIFALVSLIMGAAWFAKPRSHPIPGDPVYFAIVPIDPSLATRGMVTLQTLEMIWDFPLLGVGIGAWSEIFPRYQHYPIVFNFTNAHNDYVEWLAEVGIGGASILLVLFAVFIRGVSSTVEPDALRRRAILGGAVAVAAVHAIGDFSLRIPANALIIAALLGTLWRVTRTLEPATRDQNGLPWPAKVAAVAVITVALCLGTFEWRDQSLARALEAGERVDTAATASAEVLERDAYARGDHRGAGVEPAYRAVLASPARTYAHHALARAYRSLRMKEIELRRAVAAAPAFGDVRVEYAAVLLARGRMPEALFEVEEALYQDPRVTGYPFLSDGRTARLDARLAKAVRRGLSRRAAEWPEAAHWLSVFDAGRQRQ